MASSIERMFMVLPQVVLEAMQEAEVEPDLKGAAKKAFAMAAVRRKLQEKAAHDGIITLSEELVVALVPPMIERMVAVQNGALVVDATPCCASMCMGNQPVV